jgi:hypothetical protein
LSRSSPKASYLYLCRFVKKFPKSQKASYSYLYQCRFVKKFPKSQKATVIYTCVDFKILLFFISNGTLHSFELWYTSAFQKFCFNFFYAVCTSSIPSLHIPSFFIIQYKTNYDWWRLNKFYCCQDMVQDFDFF